MPLNGTSTTIMSTTLNSRSVEAATSLPAPVSSIAQAVAISVLFAVAFWQVLTSMYGSWFDERTSMEHGILVVPAAAYMVWTMRVRLAHVVRHPSAWGLMLVFLGAVQASLGIAAHWTWVSRAALLVSLVGAIAAMHGFRMVRALAYPLCTLSLMIAPPTFVYE